MGIVDVVDPVMKFILVRKFLPAAVRQMREGVWAVLVPKTSLGAPWYSSCPSISLVPVSPGRVRTAP